MTHHRNYQIRLESSPPSVREARRFFARVADEVGVMPEQRGLGVLALSELVTNAIVHGTGPVEVRAVEEGRSIRWEVSDDNPELPRPRAAAPEEAGGRGLAIVAAVAEGWGYERSGVPRGKHVWFLLPVDDAG